MDVHVKFQGRLALHGKIVWAWFKVYTLPTIEHNDDDNDDISHEEDILNMMYVIYSS